MGLTFLFLQHLQLRKVEVEGTEYWKEGLLEKD